MITPFIISPLCLIQEKTRDTPWRMLVACIMLNQTAGKRAESVWKSFFELWPTPESLFDSDDIVPIVIENMRNVLRPIGLQNVRSLRIWRMTFDYLVLRPDRDFSIDVKRLTGVGKYASDSWRIFVKGDCPNDEGEVHDKELKNYVRWARSIERLRSRDDEQ